MVTRGGGDSTAGADPLLLETAATKIVAWGQKNSQALILLRQIRHTKGDILQTKRVHRRGGAAGN